MGKNGKAKKKEPNKTNEGDVGAWQPSNPADCFLSEAGIGHES